MDKTQYLQFIQKIYNRKLSMKIEHNSAAQITKTKLLGIITDEKLNLKDHVPYLSIISEAIGVNINTWILGERLSCHCTIPW